MPNEDSAGSRTKHDQIIKHIEQLKTGSKISVRKIARDLAVSEGTAYRGIKEAENLGLVSTKERIGTVRVEKKQRSSMDKLTFEEVVHIVDGEVLGGAEGLGKRLNKFVIGAMEQEAMLRYIDAGSLLIVGNRKRAHSLALQHGAAVLITGGFGASDEIKMMADRLELPIISSTHDTFTVASMINRAIYDRLIKKKIMLVEDILSPGTFVYAMKSSQKAADWRQLVEETGHHRFPVVDEWNRVIGMITAKDAAGAGPEQPIERLMTRSPVTARLQTSVASAAHQMVWEGIELLPVVDGSRKLIGVVGRSDVLQMMQHIQGLPKTGETFDDLMWAGFEEERDAEGQPVFRGAVTPRMTDHLGAVSSGVLLTLMTKAAGIAVQEHKKGDLVIDNISIYYLRPVALDSRLEIVPRIIEISRKFAKIDVEISASEQLAAKAMLLAHLFDPQ